MQQLNGDLKNGQVALGGVESTQQATGTKQATRVSLVVSIPIILLIGITTNVLTLSIEAYNTAAVASDAVVRAIDLSYVVNKLQIERGFTSMFLSSNRSNLKAFAGLMDARSDTELQLYKLGTMPTLVVNNYTLRTKDDLEEYVGGHRTRADRSWPLVTLEENMNFYTDINRAVLAEIAKSITVPSFDRWLIAFNSLFLARDISGIKRAIGSTYYSPCTFSPAHRRWFSSLEVQFNTYLGFTFRYHPESKVKNDEVIDHDMERHLKVFNEHLMDVEYDVICMKDSMETRHLMSQFWFDNMTLYINHLAVIMANLADDLSDSLIDMRTTANTEMIAYSSVLIFVLLCSGATVYLIYVMTASMQEIARGLNSKTIELETERTRIEELLDQMLPKTVADKLKMNMEVEAEYYDMVTIYFSDVVGFTRISAMLSPHQVVDFLNDLYSLFDMIIDRYDAYKVETIGDAYMVASGIPERNGNEHARQIARMALTIQKSSSNFIIPHTDENIKIRSGIHSGPCASGVVGKKMPRYCLFGDTVNTASRMESTGEACRVHVSGNTKALLDIFGGFACEERGTITVKGKGSMGTYWLLDTDEDKPKQKTNKGEGNNWQQTTVPGTVDNMA